MLCLALNARSNDLRALGEDSFDPFTAKTGGSPRPVVRHTNQPWSTKAPAQKGGSSDSKCLMFCMVLYWFVLSSTLTEVKPEVYSVHT